LLASHLPSTLAGAAVSLLILAAPQDRRGSKDDPGPPFPYARESNGVADIGAYEVQQEDSIFATSGETCVPLPPPT